MYKKVTEEVIKKITGIVGYNNILTARETMEDYAHDEFALTAIRSYPEIVVKPGTAEEVALIMKVANQESIPVTPRGGGTGLSGGCVPVFSGIVLDCANMNRVLEIDKVNFMVVAEAGVTLSQLYEALDSQQLFFPPHPGDEFAMLGGLIASNAGGARAVKHGTIRNFVRGIEAVLPNGEILGFGGKIIKDSSGYSLLHLMIGSEGTLGVITKATISVMLPSNATWSLVIPYNDLSGAMESVLKINQSGILPLALEFLDNDAIEATEKLLGKKWPCGGSQSYLMAIVDGATGEEVEKTVELLAEICLANNAEDVFIANTKQKQAEILHIRSQVYEALKPETIEILDIVVPRSEIVKHVSAVRLIADKYKVWLPTYGHAADGNVHTHIMKVGLKDGKPANAVENWQDYYLKIKEEIYRDAVLRGGKISGEHGIGLSKKEFLQQFLPKGQIDLMRTIKRCFDPNNILNPGKVF